MIKIISSVYYMNMLSSEFYIVYDLAEPRSVLIGSIKRIRQLSKLKHGLFANQILKPVASKNNSRF